MDRRASVGETEAGAREEWVEEELTDRPEHKDGAAEPRGLRKDSWWELVGVSVSPEPSSTEPRAP